MKAYEGCHDPFVRYCSALAYDKMDTEDLVQDVLLSAFRHWDKVEKKGQLLHYLIRAARNRSISIWRKRRRETNLKESHHERLRSQGVPADTMVDVHLLYKALDKLPSKQRDAVVLYEVSGFSMKEIAEIQQSSEGAVKVKVSRGRAKLRELMADEPHSDGGANALGVLRSIAL